MAARAHSSPVHTLRVDGEQLCGISHAPPCMSLSPTPMLVTLGGGAMPGGSGGGVGGGGTVQNWRSRGLVVQPTWQHGVQRVQLHHPCPAGQVHALVSLLPVVLVSLVFALALEPFVPFMSVPSVMIISEAFVPFCAFPSSTPTHTMPAPSRSSVHKMQHATSQFLPHHHEQPHHTRSMSGSSFFSKWCFSGWGGSSSALETSRGDSAGAGARFRHLDGAVPTSSSRQRGIVLFITLCVLDRAYVSLKTPTRNGQFKRVILRCPTCALRTIMKRLQPMPSSVSQKPQGGLAVWIAWLSAIFLPWFVWPLRYAAKSVPKRARVFCAAVDHGIVVVASIGCLVGLGLTLTIHLFQARMWVRSLVCEPDPLASSFANNHLVGWLATVLVFLVLTCCSSPSLQFLLHPRPWILRSPGNASHIGAVWWLMIEHSRWHFVQALLVCCDLLAKHTLCLTWMRYKKEDLQRVYEFVLSAMLALLSLMAMVYGGIAYSTRCDTDKRYGSLIVMLHVVREWSLLREVLRFVIEREAFKRFVRHGRGGFHHRTVRTDPPPPADGDGNELSMFEQELVGHFVATRLKGIGEKKLAHVSDHVIARLCVLLLGDLPQGRDVQVKGAARLQARPGWKSLADAHAHSLLSLGVAAVVATALSSYLCQRQRLGIATAALDQANDDAFGSSNARHAPKSPKVAKVGKVAVTGAFRTAPSTKDPRLQHAQVAPRPRSTPRRSLGRGDSRVCQAGRARAVRGACQQDAL